MLVIGAATGSAETGVASARALPLQNSTAIQAACQKIRFHFLETDKAQANFFGVRATDTTFFVCSNYNPNSRRKQKLFKPSKIGKADSFAVRIRREFQNHPFG
jgi:hypothetical protein